MFCNMLITPYGTLFHSMTLAQTQLKTEDKLPKDADVKVFRRNEATIQHFNESYVITKLTEGWYMKCIA